MPQTFPDHTLRGFTLFELLITLAVLTLLTTVTIGSLGMVRNASRSLACRNQLRQLISCTLALTADNQGRLPASTNAYTSDGISTWPVLSSGGLFKAINDSGGGGNFACTTANVDYAKAKRTGLYDPATRSYSTYCYNERIGGDPGYNPERVTLVSGTMAAIPWPVAKLPANTLVFHEKEGPWYFYNSFSGFYNTFTSFYFQLQHAQKATLDTSNQNFRLRAPVHNNLWTWGDAQQGGWINGAYADGRVQALAVPYQGAYNQNLDRPLPDTIVNPAW